MAAVGRVTRAWPLLICQGAAWMRLNAQLRTAPGEVRLLISSLESGDVLKARLPPPAAHPRALLTMLEGIALWGGAALSVATVAERDCLSWLGWELHGDELWPSESQLVRYEVVDRGHRKRLRGLGDLRRARARCLGGDR